MKKVFLALAVIAALVFTKCKQVESNETTTVDTVQVDTLGVDTTKIDSTGDSCAVLDPSELELECTCSPEE